ncbi:hypothetical protein EMIHUDRAFT_219912 [Emiliania huxleyi CCMP1516]|uniref:Peroxiredoxin n=2 Tax=Emiliania huxleyi TaxID=2903 RepID=A0A0D3I3G9_EMIH1|nr:hypothetical protein EMIHUDRAFT_219912 [Emiliania huxleyi CCMP1516]EOD05804.1 hypothetical protein EMIHUDRAFT_219912 [Emiliania huxleyi CCMP1516]|eukprot:XP_005758233.1 hypothetical protein EMIHUDRAFT_219912 [Emiliania huxleyi CCMP1516]
MGTKPMTVTVGDSFPTDAVVHIGFAGGPNPATPVKTGSLITGRKVLVVTLPGAFTPT